MDPSSLANLEAARCSSMHLVWQVDFAASTLSGTVAHTVELLADTTEVVFDATAALAAGVDGAGVTVDGEAVAVSTGAQRGQLGVGLHVALPAGKQAKGTTLVVSIPYTVGKEASALQFLTPEMTADKKEPYLFTQCQAIHARSIIPCMDAPGAKVTYTAEVTVAAPLTALMSALRDGDPTEADGKRTFRFRQPVAMSTYLVALAVGLLEGRDVGPRSTVWAEPSVVEAAAYEFAETESYLTAAEALLTPYVWTRYDLLCLPPSFPYGGMENPCLTFVTPTLLAGDRSLADVVAHEAAHSWTGNLVTNAQWRDFWLNEGCTMWVQRKIVSAVHGGEQQFDFDVVIGREMLEESVRVFGEDNPLTALVPDLSGDIDPDDAFSSVPYEKGFSLLYYLCKTVGGFAAWDPFFKEYIASFSHKTVTTEAFKAFFLSWFEGKADLSGINWDKWFNTPGMAPVEYVDLDDTLHKACTDLVAAWAASPDGVDEDMSSFVTGQKIVFLDELTKAHQADAATFTTDVLARIDAKYGFSTGKNCELLFRFLRIQLRAGSDGAVEKVSAFLKSQGRMKYVRPLFRELAAVNKDAAVALFEEHGACYHPICQKMVAADLGVGAK